MQLKYLVLCSPKEFLLSNALFLFIPPAVLGTAKPWEQLQAGQLLLAGRELPGQDSQGPAPHATSPAVLGLSLLTKSGLTFTVQPEC
jgi:hypothetical protein